MPIVRLKLRDLSLTEKIQFARQIVTAMTDPPSTPSKEPEPTKLTAGPHGQSMLSRKYAVGIGKHTRPRVFRPAPRRSKRC